METGQERIIDTHGQQESGDRPRREVLLRAAQPTDAAAIGAMGDRCSKKSLAQRFHSGVPSLPRGFVESVVANAGDRINLVAVDPTHERIVGLGSWCQTEPNSGEIGLLVEDAYQSHGIGARLLRGLVRGARARGSTTFEAVVLRDQVELAFRLAGPAGHLRLDPHGEVTALRATIPPPRPVRGRPAA
jgi:GNAT superfamily N-acetyltransferase